MKKQTREALNAYYVEADSWAHDRVDALQVSRRTAWRVAFAAALVAVLEAIALIVLMPLKTVEPYTLLVDRQTGFVQALKPIDAERIAPDRGADPVLPRPICDRPRELRHRRAPGQLPQGRAVVVGPRRAPTMSPAPRSRTRTARSPAIRARPSSRPG